MKKLKIPYAIADYVECRNKGYYYVDKTRFIEKLESYKAPVFLRPRRFGKSLLCSMLSCYYDLRQADQFERLFGDTYIGQHPTEEHNQYLVLRFDFSKLVMADSVGELEMRFNQLNCTPINSLVRRDAYYAHLFAGLKFRDEDNASTMLEDTLAFVKDHNLPPLYIIVDEYDNFTNQLVTAYKDPLYEEVTTTDSFLRTFFEIIKAGIGEGTVRTCFVTGVLPITMDDLTSGYNIAEMLTLDTDFIDMLGFTYPETMAYLKYIIEKYVEEEVSFDVIWQLIVNNYDGYHFLPESEPLFNSTILTYFLKKFSLSGGELPDEMIDDNLRTDINWIRRLTLNLENSKEMLDRLMIDGEMNYNLSDLRSKFNRDCFFDKNFYPISLYYLGMTTLKDRFVMELPSLTMKSIYMDYYNRLNEISGDANRFAPTFRAFFANRDLEPIVKVYCEQYLGQFPAQVFDKVNENFIRCSFFELCSRYMSHAYTFALEQNLPSGRSDLEFTGVPGTSFFKDDRIVEFKYFKVGDEKRVMALGAPYADDVEQVKGYAQHILAKFPYYNVRTFVVYIVANKGYRFWEV